MSTLNARPVLASIARAWAIEPRGRALLAAWAATFVGVTGRALWLRIQTKKRLRAAAAAASSTASVAGSGGADACPRSSPVAIRKPPSPFTTVLRLAFPTYRSKTTGWFIALSVGIGVRLLVSVKVSSEIGVLGSLLARRDWDALFRRQLGYAIWAIPAAALGALQKLTANRAALALRSELMERVHSKLARADQLPLALHHQPDANVPSDPSALLTEAPSSEINSSVHVSVSDTSAFCTKSVELFEALVKPVVEVSLLSTKLVGLMGARQLLHCYGFFFLAGCWTRLVGPSLSTMSVSVGEAEAALLAGHARLATHAEEIALVGGGHAEATALNKSLAALRSRLAKLQLQRFGSEALDGGVTPPPLLSSS